jgi:hypothetical protein
MTAVAFPGQLPPGAIRVPVQQNQGRVSMQQNADNAGKLEQAVAELMVSSYDPVVGKTMWQCAQCHFKSKIKYTVKTHVETHLSGFIHQCPHCDKQCKTTNALRSHVMRAHAAPSSSSGRQQGSSHQGNQGNWNGGDRSTPDEMMQMQFHEGFKAGMASKAAKKPGNWQGRKNRPYDEELEREIRLLLVSNYDPVEAKTTWTCAQCQYSNKLQYTVKQHIETHINSIVHQCAECDTILKTRNALRAHMRQKHEPKQAYEVNPVAFPGQLPPGAIRVPVQQNRY